jgi:hypothetical protein
MHSVPSCVATDCIRSSQLIMHTVLHKIWNKLLKKWNSGFNKTSVFFVAKLLKLDISYLVLKYNQQDATLHKLFISVKCSKCFRRFLRPSSGVQNCIYSIGYFVKPLLLPATVVEGMGLTVAGSSKGLTKYPILYTQFWVPDVGRSNRLKHVEHFTEINKLCNVASCWLYLKIRLRCTDPRTSNVVPCFFLTLC